MKKFILGFISGAILFGAAGTFAADVWQSINVLPNTIKVIVDGKEVQADNFLYNDTTYLPIRAVSEALKMNVQYDNVTSTAIISNADTPAPTPTAKDNLSPLPEVEIEIIDGAEYVRKSNIEKMLDALGLGQYKFSATYFYNDLLDDGSTILSDIPHHPTNNELIPIDYYNSTIIPTIHTLQ